MRKKKVDNDNPRTAESSRVCNVNMIATIGHNNFPTVKGIYAPKYDSLNLPATREPHQPFHLTGDICKSKSK